MPDQDIALKFGQLLRQSRQKSSLTQEQLAKKTGLTAEHIQRLEGKKPSGVRLETVIKITNALEVKISAFLKDFDV